MLFKLIKNECFVFDSPNNQFKYYLRSSEMNLCCTRRITKVHFNDTSTNHQK